MAQGGFGRSLQAVAGDLTTGLCAAVAPRARAGGRHLALIPRLQAEPCPAGIEAALEELGHKIEELERLHAAGTILRDA
jgi:hypothetical protein